MRYLLAITGPLPIFPRAGDITVSSTHNTVTLVPSSNQFAYSLGIVDNEFRGGTEQLSASAFAKAFTDFTATTCRSGRAGSWAGP
jgi:hypothetical protein